jgi:CheY-like chemotaxis protein
MQDRLLPLDDEVARHSALVIDSNPGSRSVTLQNLRSFGFGLVKQCSRVIDGRNMLEHRRFNLVVCDAHFDLEHSSGIELLEELRREQLLPYSTVFVMIASEATYQQVADAAESALDGFIIKPFSANMLAERVKEARQRKRHLRDIFEALEQRDLSMAADLCLERFQSRKIYWLYAARIGAELLLRLQRAKEAKALFEAVSQAKTVPWARLGVARAQFADGDVAQARRTVEALLEEQPSNADANDILGRIQTDQGDLEEAAATFERATQLTPDCILRLQHTGTLNFYAGKQQKALDCLQRAAIIGRKSRLLDYLSLLLLAFIHFDRRETPGLEKSVEHLERAASLHPQSARLKRFKAVAEMLLAAQQGRASLVFSEMKRLARSIRSPEFDMEAAINLMSLIVRLRERGVPQAEVESPIQEIARRFVTTRATHELLLAASGHHEDVATCLQKAQADLANVTQRAVDFSLDGKAEDGVKMLLQFGSATYNAKAIELAGLLLQRYRAQIASAAALADEQGVLNRRYCNASTHIAGVRRSGRSAGGLVLRT